MDTEQIINNLLSNNSKLLENLTGGLLVLYLILLLISIAALIIFIIGLAKLFEKAGKPGWVAIIPFYNTYVLIEIAGLNWWYFLIAISRTIFSILGIKGLASITWIAAAAVHFFIFYNLGKKFKKDPITYGILGAIFAGIIGAILGFSIEEKYDSSVVVSPNGPIDDKRENSNANTTKEPERFCLGCGKKLKPDAKFCGNCGKKVKDPKDKK